MKRTIWISLIVMVAMLGILGCGKKPASVVESFYTLVGQGKVNDAFGLLSKESSAMLSAFGGSTALMDESKKIQQRKGIKKFEVISEEIHGDTAQIKFKITFGDGSSKEGVEKLMKTDDGWRIVMSK